MKTLAYIPNSLKAAGHQMRLGFCSRLESLSKDDFTRVWSSVLYLFPGLHPDGYEDSESGWPRALKRFAAEAWQRKDSGELADDELYPCDAQWSGVYDRLGVHKTDEMIRRLELAASSAD